MNKVTILPSVAARFFAAKATESQAAVIIGIRPDLLARMLNALPHSGSEKIEFHLKPADTAALVSSVGTVTTPAPQPSPQLTAPPAGAAEGSRPSSHTPSPVRGPLVFTALRATDCRGGYKRTPVPYRVGATSGTADNAADALTAVLRAMEKLRSGMLPRLAALVRGNSRNHIATSRELVYPSRPDLAKNAHEIIPGWFIGTNTHNREKRLIVEKACEVTGLRYDLDVHVTFPHEDK